MGGEQKLHPFKLVGTDGKLHGIPLAAPWDHLDAVTEDFSQAATRIVREDTKG
jgi:hypothetical protein